MKELISLDPEYLKSILKSKGNGDWKYECPMRETWFELKIYNYKKVEVCVGNKLIFSMWVNDMIYIESVVQMIFLIFEQTLEKDMDYD